MSPSLTLPKNFAKPSVRAVVDRALLVLALLVIAAVTFGARPDRPQAPSVVIATDQHVAR